jgi:adenosylmethionine---8-amino-7-oxononanoate aminotransferase
VDAGIWLRPFGNVIYTMPPFTITSAELSAITGAMSDILPRWADRAPTAG